MCQVDHQGRVVYRLGVKRSTGRGQLFRQWLLSLYRENRFADLTLDMVLAWGETLPPSLQFKDRKAAQTQLDHAHRDRFIEAIGPGQYRICRHNHPNVYSGEILN